MKIPNNFKIKEGLAFGLSSKSLRINSGLVGVYNMGNTCFINTGNYYLFYFNPVVNNFIAI